MPELRHLRAFVAVAEQLSFTRAAELLHLTQQTVSRTVGELERELGVSLLERTTREVRLTAAGASLLRDGIEAVRAAEAAFARAREIGSGSLGLVRIGLSPAIGPRDRDETLHSARLRPTPMVLCAPSEHALAGRSSIGLRDLDGSRLLVASPRGTSYTDLLVDAIEAAGATVAVVEARVTGGAAFLTPLADEDVVALMPAGTSPREGVAIVGVDDFTVPLVLLWPAGLPSAAVARLRAALS